MKLKLSELIRQVCHRCGRELSSAGLWFEDWLGNRYCSYRCKHLKLQKDKKQEAVTWLQNNVRD
jgi:hypothetical protein